MRAAVFSLFLSMVVTTALFAHQTLLRALPAGGAALSVRPTFLQLVFREPLQAAFTKVTLLGPDSLPVVLGDLRIHGDSATIASLGITGSLTAGRHTVTWRTTGADGHAVSGSYTFVVLAPAVSPPADVPAVGTVSPAAPVQAVPDGGPVLEVGDWWYVLVRWGTFVALLGVVGAVFFRWAVLPVFGRAELPGASRTQARLVRNTARLGRAAAQLLLLAAAARLVAQALTMLDSTEPITAGWLSALLGATVWGRAWVLQATGAVIAWAGFGRAARSRRSSGWILATSAAFPLAVTPALSGHAVATPDWTLLAVAADTLHVVAAGGWMGGLAVLVLVGLPTIQGGPSHNRAGTVARLVQAFSPPALILGGLVGLTGLVGAWLHLETIGSLWSTRYGQTLMVKLGVVGVLFGLGAVNFLRVRPSLGEEAGSLRLRRSAGWELAVGLGVLLVTAVLVALPPAMKMNPMQIHEPILIPDVSQPED
jgi:putative copper export protein/methionine-rich copper-binding protein CopC